MFILSLVGYLLIVLTIASFVVPDIKSAGLTPQERAEWDYKKAIGVAQQLKDLRLPSTYIEGGTGKDNQGNLLESLIGAELAKGMLKK